MTIPPSCGDRTLDMNALSYLLVADCKEIKLPCNNLVSFLNRASQVVNSLNSLTLRPSTMQGAFILKKNKIKIKIPTSH